MTLDRNEAMKKAKQAARSYCKDNNLSERKLATQSCLYFGDVVGFMQQMPYNGTGLKEDMNSLPKPTLLYHIASGAIETTEFTEEYLS